MGNNSSKSSKKDGLQSYPSFSRTDTQGSTRSTRSIRSRLSINSDQGSFKSALDQYDPDFGSNDNITGQGSGISSNSIGKDSLGQPDISSSNGGLSAPNTPHIRASSFNNDNNGSSRTPLGSSYGASGSAGGSGALGGPSSAGGVGISTDGYPFPTVLPKSMQQLAPKEPILMRRDKDGNFTAPNTPGTDSFNSSSTGVDSVSQSQTALNNDSTSGTVGDTTISNPTSGNNTNNNSATNSSINISSATSKSNSTENTPTPLSISTPSHDSSNSSVANSFTNSSSIPSNPTTPRNIPKLQLPSSPAAPLNVEEIIQRLLDAGYSGKTTRSVCLKNSEIVLICQVAREIFLSQPTLLELSTPVKIVGDVHGQYGDLIRLFDMCGFPPAANYLFLGDYVDRGKQSLETILLLLCYKIKYPENFFLLRGNHECANVTRVYGFFDECKRRCNTKTWKIFIDTFNSLPIAAVVAQKIFCVHGGLSPALNNLNEIRNIERPTDVPDYGLLNDLLWSDPADTGNEWEDNERGVSYCFNKVAINKFLAKFSFDLVCRAHMVVEDGYEFFNERSLVTVFSAPNYCGEFDNWGAVMSVSEGLLCSFELLKPLDSVALKQVMKKGKHERRNGLLSSPSPTGPQSY